MSRDRLLNRIIRYQKRIIEIEQEIEELSRVRRSYLQLLGKALHEQNNI
jgi:hypothetical protein